jgi:xyloglucan-specific exo-beta-1,4-glucanase
MKQRPVPPTSAAKPPAARWLALAVLCTLALLGTLTVFSGAALAVTPPDTTPPSKPATPAIDTITPTVATIRPTGSFDNDAVAGYSALRLLNGVWTQWAFTNIDVDTIYLRDLSPGTTYTLAVVAFDNAGNQSPRSDPLTFTTPSTSAPTCRVQRTVLGTTFMVQVFAENLTTVSIGNWTVTFTMPATQTVLYRLGANISRNGDQATLTGASVIATIVPGMTTNSGFVAGNPAGAPLPSTFAFNSPAFGTISCAVS